MSRKVVVVLILMLTIGIASAAEKIAGDITGVLTKAKSPYIVTGDLVVPALDTLIIEPGVEIYFDSLYAFKVRGLLLARGTANQVISFTSHLAKPGSWKGIRFRNSANDKSVLHNCRVSYAQVGIYITATSPEIAYNEISENSQHGIQCRVSASQIALNKIIKNGWDGLCLKGFTGVVENNRILANGDDGIDLEKSTGTILNNIIEANKDDGIVCTVSSPVIKDNLIIKNGDDGILLQASSPRIVNNVLARHVFGLFTYQKANPILSNVTIIENQYGVYARDHSHPVIDSSILWQNETAVKADSISSVSISYSDVAGGYEGKKNFDKNPLFVDTRYFILDKKSPCRGAGNAKPPTGEIIVKKLVGAQLEPKER